MVSWRTFLSLVLLAAAALPAEEINRIVLRVNDRIATQKEYESRRDDRVQMLASAQGLDEAERRRLVAEAGRATMKEIFDELLILSRAQQMRVIVTRDQINRALAASRERYGLASDEEFAAALAEAGLRLDDYRVRLERQLQWQEVIGREVQPRIKVDEEAVQRFYRENADRFRVPERIEVQEIVVLEQARPGDPEGLRALADGIHGRLVAGEGMAEVAATHAERGETSALVELGWVERGELDTALEAAAWALAPGEISAPVPARGGLHIVRVAAREPAGLRPLAEVRAQIEAAEQDRQYEREMGRYLAELAARAFVAESLPPDAAGYRELAPPAEVDPLAPVATRSESGPEGEPEAGSKAP
ncbi:MAG: peptidyl-prolyl cis-trans isomerase [Thermoanaerobaculia bacterium]|nr:peptidyl-prolyl cis-trans isomerase [Thermoanaerobaculia bacterium]MCZ7652932.1 peptidylprolyl isomerase [Thermoanaerobaculia bacterium]